MALGPEINTLDLVYKSSDVPPLAVSHFHFLTCTPLPPASPPLTPPWAAAILTVFTCSHIPIPGEARDTGHALFSCVLSKRQMVSLSCLTSACIEIFIGVMIFINSCLLCYTMSQHHFLKILYPST